MVYLCFESASGINIIVFYLIYSHNASIYTHIFDSSLLLLLFIPRIHKLNQTHLCVGNKYVVEKKKMKNKYKFVLLLLLITFLKVRGRASAERIFNTAYKNTMKTLLSEFWIIIIIDWLYKFDKWWMNEWRTDNHDIYCILHILYYLIIISL